jgi:hypothetical protein
MVLQRLLLVSAMCLAAALAWAEEPLNGDATREYILEDVPNFPTILKDQWSNRVPTTAFDGGRSNYGLLSENEAERPITLAESIALVARAQHRPAHRGAQPTPPPTRCARRTRNSTRDLRRHLKQREHARVDHQSVHHQDPSTTSSDLEPVLPIRSIGMSALEGC